MDILKLKRNWISVFKKKSKDFKKILEIGKRIHKIAFQADKKVYIAYLMVIIIGSILPFLISWVSGRVIDTLIEAVNSPEMRTALITIIVIYITLMAFQGILSSLRNYFDNTQYMDVMGRMTILIQKAFSKLSIEHHENPEFNDTIQKAKDSYSFRPALFLDRSNQIIAALIALFSSLIIVITFSPLIFLVILIGSIPTFVTELKFGRVKFGIFGADAEIKRNFWHSGGYLSDQDSLSEIKIFKSENYFIKLIDQIFYKYHNREKAIQQKRNLALTFLSVFSAATFGFAYWLVAEQVLAGQISVGLFTFYIGTISRTDGSLGRLLREIAQTYENGLYSEDIFKIIDATPKIKDGVQTLVTKNAPPLIKFENVSFKYPNTNDLVFKNLNFQIKPGENIAIVGENGAGKTTFVKLLSRFYDVTDGRILVDGINLSELRLDNWYSNLSMLSQDFTRYHFDAKTNIGLGDVSDMKNIEKIKSSAKISGANDFIEKYKNKYNQILNKRFTGGTEPSTGQWQKIAIARALFKEPKILILDEPTSAIDPKSESEIFDKLFEYGKEKTIIIISHRFSTVRNADRIVVIDQGEIIEQGSHQELIKLNGKYKQAYEIQKKGYTD